jgi:tetratricopeptide (TPR) repeat protein
LYRRRGLALDHLGRSSDDDFAHAEALGAMDGATWLQRGQLDAGRGRLDRALADFAAAVKAGADDPRAWYWQALIRLHQGDGAGYRAVCRDMLRRFEKSTEEDAPGWTAWTCCLGPDAGVSLLTVQVLENEARLRRRTGPSKELPRALPERTFLSPLAKAEPAVPYRRGKFEDVTKLPGPDAKERPHAVDLATYHLFRAMACCRLGRKEEARRLLDQAVKDVGAEKDLPWDRELEFRLLLREAKQELNKKAGPLGPS